MNRFAGMLELSGGGYRVAAAVSIAVFCVVLLESGDVERVCYISHSTDASISHSVFGFLFQGHFYSRTMVICNFDILVHLWWDRYMRVRQRLKT
jgi:hypothetical protein